MAWVPVLEYPVFLKEEQEDRDTKNHPPLDDFVRNSTPIDQKPETCVVDQIAKQISADVADKRCTPLAVETEGEPAVEQEAHDDPQNNR
jgi:hypothetical protein